MAIVVRLDVMLALRKMTARDLAARIGIAEQNLSLLRSGKVRGVRFSTLEAICRELECQPGDLLEVIHGAGTGEQQQGRQQEQSVHDASAHGVGEAIAKVTLLSTHGKT